jgi:hypothetical protein
VARIEYPSPHAGTLLPWYPFLGSELLIISALCYHFRKVPRKWAAADRDPAGARVPTLSCHGTAPRASLFFQIANPKANDRMMVGKEGRSDD